MLLLQRHEGETIHIGENITVQVQSIQGKRTTLAIDAPRDVLILRGELRERENVDGMSKPADSGRVGDASAEDRFEQYVKTLIDHAPDVQKLGERLAHLLDDDQFNNIEPTLLGIAAALAAQGQGGEVGYTEMTVGGWAVATLRRHALNLPAGTKLYTAPPASPAGVPDARTEMDYEYDAEGLLDPYDSGHMAGWNDCRKVMLAAPSATPEGGEVGL